MRCICSRMAARSTTHGTPVKSCKMTRPGLKAISLTAVLGFLFVDTYNGKLSIGVMVLIFQLIVQARRPLFAMSFILTRIQEAESGSKEFFEILSLPGKEKFTMKEKITPIKNPIIAFHNVSFQYDKSKEILQNITLSLHHGEKIALVGHSGAGKTTIINLIMKLYESTAGEITLNDIPYSKLSYQSIRQAISLVFQENELFSSTVAENVSYGRQSTEKEIIEALEKAQAWDFVSQLPDGIHSQVGERGVRLSGGQKQRIQIARAILKNSPILILDEATSSLDARSEKEVQQALEAVMHDKMVIIIAHRFSTIQDVQRIIVIDKGSVVDSGSPQELARRPGIYSELLRYQVEGNKKLLATFELY